MLVFLVVVWVVFLVFFGRFVSSVLLVMILVKVLVVLSRFLVNLVDRLESFLEMVWKCGFWFFGNLVLDKWKLCILLLIIFFCLMFSVVYFGLVCSVLYLLNSFRFWLSLVKKWEILGSILL